MDQALDDAVCRAMLDEHSGLARQAGTVTDLIAGSPISHLRPSIATLDEALVAWANDPRCATGADREVCEKRFRRLRRVDMRVDLRPRTVEPSTAGQTPG